MKKKEIQLANEDYEQLLAEFRHHISVLGYSNGGQMTKCSNVREFLCWLELNGINGIAQVKPADIMNHYEYLKCRPHRVDGVLKPKTIHHHTKSLRQFFVLLQASGVLKTNPMGILHFTYPQVPTPERTILSIPEIKEMYRATENMQERAILSLSYGCGLRSMELVSVNVEDIKDGILIVPKGKGNKRRVIPMTRKVEEDMQNYITYERTLFSIAPNEKALLLNILGKRIKKYTCLKILKEIIKRTGNPDIIQKKISIHNLRHSIATHLLEEGVPIEQVRTFLGHSNLETTEIYTRVSKRQLKSLIE